MARLVAIGDSLTQGFQSLAITRTDLSYPAVIARCLGLAPEAFLQPNFRGAGGLPCSVEWLARRLEERYRAEVRAFQWASALHTIQLLLDEVEDYWERGRGAAKQANLDYHNLAVWGFEVGDAFNIDSALCRQRIDRPSDGWMALPSEPRMRTAYCVLNPGQDPARDADTQLGIAKRIRERDGRIDHLIVGLGANNCLRSVLELEIRETGADPPGPHSEFTLWSSRAFEREYEELAQRVAAIGAEHVYVATIPHLMIAPVTRGIMRGGGALPEGQRYFDYYTRFFVRDADFDAARDPKLTREEAIYIDETIDTYNRTIVRAAERYGFSVVDVCGLVDALAVRRNHGKPRFALPAALADLSIEMFQVAPGGGVLRGGLVSLDGLHPTACGYGLIAQAFVNKIRAYEPSIRDVNFQEVRDSDPLVSSPPQTLDDMLGTLQTLERYFNFSKWMSSHHFRL